MTGQVSPENLPAFPVREKRVLTDRAFQAHLTIWNLVEFGPVIRGGIRTAVLTDYRREIVVAILPIK